MEYTLSRIIEDLSRIIEDLSRIIEDAIRRFGVAWKLKRPKNDDDDDLAYIAYMLGISIIVAIIAGILSHLLY